jgi:hypothetical protein
VVDDSYTLPRPQRINKTLMKNYSLLILPCNKGAQQGNYFLGQLWKRFEKALIQEGLREDVHIAAIDCIVSFLKNDGLGAIVHETEMDRVRGFDSHPSKFFDIPDIQKRNLRVQKLSEDIEVGLKRWEIEYDHLLIFSNTLAYRMAIKYAVDRLNLWDKTCLVDFPATQIGIHHNAVQIALDSLRFKEVGVVKIPLDLMYRFKSKNERDRWQDIWERRVNSFVCCG